MRPDYERAFKDIVDGVLSSEIWGRFGWQEVRRRYRRTSLGPFWTTLSLGIFVTALGLVWSEVWHQDLRNYLPYLSSGLVAWTLVQTIISEGCLSITQYEGIIKNFDFSYSVLATTVVWRNIIVFFHNVLVFIVIAVIFKVHVGWQTFLVIPGLFFIAVNGIWVSLLLGMVCARFRDVQPLVASVLQIALFVTPIMWSADQLGGKRWLILYPNLLYHIVDVLRSPLLGHIPAPSTYAAVVLLTIIGWMMTFLIFARFRRRVPFWV